jgi:hypothetical protein
LNATAAERFWREAESVSEVYMLKPPTEKHTYFGTNIVGVCDKCGQPICERATLEEEHFSTKREGIEWLRNYVSEKLKKSGVIPDSEICDLTESIVHSSLRTGTHKLPDAEGRLDINHGEFACIRQADFEVEWTIRVWKDMPPITSKRFSLKAFTEVQR